MAPEDAETALGINLLLGMTNNEKKLFRWHRKSVAFETAFDDEVAKGMKENQLAEDWKA